MSVLLSFSCDSWQPTSATCPKARTNRRYALRHFFGFGRIGGFRFPVTGNTAQVIQRIPLHAFGYKVTFLLRFEQKVDGINSPPSIGSRSTRPVGEGTVYRLVGTQATDHFFHGRFSRLLLFAGQRGDPAQVQLRECLRSDLSTHPCG